MGTEKCGDFLVILLPQTLKLLRLEACTIMLNKNLIFLSFQVMFRLLNAGTIL